MPQFSVPEAMKDWVREGVGERNTCSNGVKQPSEPCGRWLLKSSCEARTLILASFSLRKTVGWIYSSRCSLLKLSQSPFCHGEPGSMWSTLTPSLSNHSLIAIEMNFGPLSQRMRFGTPSVANGSASVSIASSLVMLRPNLILKQSRVCSSTIFRNCSSNAKANRRSNKLGNVDHLAPIGRCQSG